MSNHFNNPEKKHLILTMGRFTINVLELLKYMRNEGLKRSSISYARRSQSCQRIFPRLRVKTLIFLSTSSHISLQNLEKIKMIRPEMAFICYNWIFKVWNLKSVSDGYLNLGIRYSSCKKKYMTLRLAKCVLLA